MPILQVVLIVAGAAIFILVVLLIAIARPGARSTSSRGARGSDSGHADSMFLFGAGLPIGASEAHRSRHHDGDVDLSPEHDVDSGGGDPSGDASDGGGDSGGGDGGGGDGGGGD